MFYFAVVLCVVCIFLSVTNRKDISTRYFIGMMLAYTSALFFMMIYLAKDTYYNNAIENYFSMPLSIWKALMFLPLNKEFLICIWNFSYCLALALGLQFAMSFGKYEDRRRMQILKKIVFLLLGLEYMVFHPYVQKFGYCLVYPSLLDIYEIEKLQYGIHIAAMVLNEAILWLGVGILIVSYRKVTPLKIIRHNMLFLVVSYIMIISVYRLILEGNPAFLMQVSKTADVVLFQSLEINDSKILHLFLPYYLIGIVVLICILLYRFYRTRMKITEESIAFSKQVDASDTTSKVFCHYMKNELLAVQYELEELVYDKYDSENQDILENAISRCRNLYERLDKIHNSTKKAELYMVRTNVPELLAGILENMTHDLAGYQVIYTKKNEKLFAMIDADYFEQAMHNIIWNALDAMEGLPEERKQISIKCEGLNNWVTVFVEDRGKGMTPEQIENIFKPFYSSHTIANHWGVGMTLTHKIISAHEGYIEVESKCDYGTIVKIMLPLLRN